MPHDQLLQSLPDAAILTDPAGVVQAWNAAATRLLGWTAEEMVGRPLVERFPPAAHAEYHALMAQLAAGGEWDGTFHDYHKDGHRLWVEGRVRALRDQAGSVTGLLGLARPLSAARQAEMERDRERQYAGDILDAMSAHVAVLGPEGRIRQVNRAWVSFAHANTPGGVMPASTGVGVNYLERCRAATGPDAPDAHAAAAGIEAVLAGRQPVFVMEYPCHSATEFRWFAMHVTPLQPPEGGAVVAHSDISARKLAELAAATQAERMSLALTAAHMGVWRLDLGTNRFEWSAEVPNVIGVGDFDGRRESLRALVHPDDMPGLRTRFNEAVARRTPFAGEFRLRQPAGDYRWLASVAQVECNPAGQPVAVIGTLQDVSARKRSEWALTAYNHILELIALGTELHQILEEVVRLVEEQLPGSLCSILILDPATQQLHSGAGASLPHAYNAAIDGLVIGPKAGSCGTSAWRKATVAVTDIATDPLWEDFRDLALDHGLKSCISVPIVSSGNVPGHEKGSVIGTFAVYNRTPGDFDRLTYAILAGAERLVQEAMQGTAHGPGRDAGDSARVIEAAHLAGVAIERDQAEQAVLESEGRFRAVLDSSPLAVFVKGLDGRYLFVNRAMAAMFQVPIAHWAGQPSAELLTGELAAICDRGDHLARDTEAPVHERHTCRIAGRDLTILATHFLLFRADAQPYAVCGILRDMSDLVEAQREFERLWLHASDPLSVAGFDGYLKQVNPAWSRLLGWTEQELLGQPYAELVHPEDRAGLAAAERRIVAGESVRYETRHRCRDGTYRWFSWNAIPVLERRIIYGIAQDVTEQKRLAEQFRQAQKMEAVGQLASGVAHDFNNLLTVINGYAEVLLGEMPADDPDREALSEMLKAGRRAGELTSQLLAFSRKAIVEPRLVDVNQVVESSARMLRRLIGENVLLETSLATIPLVKIDPGQLEQVVMNLAVNARDAMPTGGSLAIKTEVVTLGSPRATEAGEVAPGRYVRLRVVDTGTGMVPEVRARIFEPFFTTKGPGKGSGLGLAMVYGIVRQAGGVIEVASEPGAGTTFEILLPAVHVVARGPEAAAAAEVPRGTETVLLAEDEPGVRKVAATILAMQGYTVLSAGTGAEALRLVAAHGAPIHLLLTDVVMPDLGGRALAEAVRSRQPAIRVLYMSGYTDDAVLRHGVESSQRAFIQKPFTLQTLARRVRDVLDAPG